MDPKPTLFWETWYGRALFPFVARLAVLACLICLPLLYPAGFLLRGFEQAGERRFRQRMKARGRFKEWEELRPTLEAGGGTLIVEQGYKAPARVWWTPDDVRSSAPCPPRDEDEIERLVHVPRSHGFVPWRHRRYTDEDVGAALLTVPVDPSPGYVLAPYFHERFPDLATIDTVYT